MDTDQKKILEMLEQGKINSAEAERLLEALKGASTESASTTPPKYLRVTVTDPKKDGGTVNVRVPLGLLKAGVKLASLIPPDAQAKINASMCDKGIKFQLSDLTPETVDEFLANIGELNVDVSGGEGETVRVYCE